MQFQTRFSHPTIYILRNSQFSSRSWNERRFGIAKIYVHQNRFIIIPWRREDKRYSMLRNRKCKRSRLYRKRLKRLEKFSKSRISCVFFHLISYAFLFSSFSPCAFENKTLCIVYRAWLGISHTLLFSQFEEGRIFISLHKCKMFYYCHHFSFFLRFFSRFFNRFFNTENHFSSSCDFL